LVREGHRVDERAEWRTFDEDKGSKERAGGPVNPLLDDGGLSNSTSIQLQPGLQHLARVQAMLKDPNKKLKQGFSVIGDMCGTLKLGNMVRDRACELYVKKRSFLLYSPCPTFFLFSPREVNSPENAQEKGQNDEKMRTRQGTG